VSAWTKVVGDVGGEEVAMVFMWLYPSIFIDKGEEGC
jgi:hypothetical protein